MVTALVLFPIGVTAAALALGWLVARTGSVWPAAFAHGAHNTLAAGLVLAPRDWLADQLASLAAAGVIGLVFGGLLWRRSRVAPTRAASRPTAPATEFSAT